MREECQEPQIYLLEHVPATIARAKTLNGHVLARALRHLTYEQFTNHINAVELPEANQAFIKTRNLSTFWGVGWGHLGKKRFAGLLRERKVTQSNFESSHCSMRRRASAAAR